MSEQEHCRSRPSRPAVFAHAHEQSLGGPAAVADIERPYNYCEYPSGRALARMVVSIWSSRMREGGPECRKRVLPDGCVDLMWIDEHSPVVVGPRTTPAIRLLRAGARIFGARFKPGAAAALLDIPIDALADRELPLSACGGALARIAIIRATLETA